MDNKGAVTAAVVIRECLLMVAATTMSGGAHRAIGRGPLPAACTADASHTRGKTTPISLLLVSSFLSPRNPRAPPDRACGLRLCRCLAAARRAVGRSAQAATSRAAACTCAPQSHVHRLTPADLLVQLSVSTRPPRSHHRRARQAVSGEAKGGRCMCVRGICARSGGRRMGVTRLCESSRV